MARSCGSSVTFAFSHLGGLTVRAGARNGARYSAMSVAEVGAATSTTGGDVVSSDIEGVAICPSDRFSSEGRGIAMSSRVLTLDFGELGAGKLAPVMPTGAAFSAASVTVAAIIERSRSDRLPLMPEPSARALLHDR